MGQVTAEAASDDEREALKARFIAVRAASEALCEPLAVEDYVVQTLAEASPAKWHLAHVTWFFETFLLKPFAAGYRESEPRYARLFNSYYNSVGEQWPRPARGQLSRPTVVEVYGYRRQVDEAMRRLLDSAPARDWAELARRTELGLQHEQQHQELLLTDLKANLSINPLFPAYRPQLDWPQGHEAPQHWLDFAGGEVTLGCAQDGFAFDNERPAHRVLLQPYRLARRPVTNGEYLEFMGEGGYQDPLLWLSDGWSTQQRDGWAAPMHWCRVDGAWFEYTLGGLRPLDPNRPVCHVSFFEADAFARWAGARLPREGEWETAVAGQPMAGNLREADLLHPAPTADAPGVLQAFGDVWEWTASPFVAYPGYRQEAGAFGEYNGKFMCNQWVVRGGSCVTPVGHLRPTYRNFFYPHDRWQFLGIRLARDL